MRVSDADVSLMLVCFNNLQCLHADVFFWLSKFYPNISEMVLKVCIIRPLRAFPSTALIITQCLLYCYTESSACQTRLLQPSIPVQPLWARLSPFPPPPLQWGRGRLASGANDSFDSSSCCPLLHAALILIMQNGGTLWPPEFSDWKLATHLKR